MKKVILIALLCHCFLVVNNQVEAAEDKDIKQTSEVSVEKEAFSNLEDTDKIVELPDGTFLHGEAIIGTIGYDGYDENEMIVVNSETVPNAVTVEEAKDLLENTEVKSNFNPTQRGVISEFKYVGLSYRSIIERSFSRRAGWNSLNTVYQSIAEGP